MSRETKSLIKKFMFGPYLEAYERGKAEGRAEGKAEGRAEGKAEGRAEGKAKALLAFLKQRDLAIDEDQQRQIMSCMDLSMLDRWRDRVLFVASVDELLA